MVSEGFSLSAPKLLTRSATVDGELDVHHEVAEREVQQASSETVEGHDMVSEGFSLSAPKLLTRSATVDGELDVHHEVAEREVQQASSETVEGHDMLLP